MNQQKSPNQHTIDDPLAEELVQTLKHMPNPTRLIDDMQESVAWDEAAKEKERRKSEKETKNEADVLSNKMQQVSSDVSVTSPEIEQKNNIIVQTEETLLDQYLKEENPDKKEKLRIQLKDSFTKLLELFEGGSLSQETREKIKRELTRIATTFFDEGEKVQETPVEKEKPIVFVKPKEEHVISVPLPIQLPVAPFDSSIPARPPLRLSPLPETAIPSPKVEQPIITTPILEIVPPVRQAVSKEHALNEPPLMMPPAVVSQVSHEQATSPSVMPQAPPPEQFSHESHIVTANDGSKGPGPTLLAIPCETKGSIFSSLRSLFRK